MIANLTLEQQGKIIEKEMRGWLREVIEDKFQIVKIGRLSEIISCNNIDLIAQYDKNMMIMDLVRVKGVRIKFSDYNSTINNLDAVVIDYVEFTLQSRLDREHSYFLKLSAKAEDCKLSSKFVSISLEPESARFTKVKAPLPTQPWIIFSSKVLRCNFFSIKLTAKAKSSAEFISVPSKSKIRSFLFVKLKLFITEMYRKSFVISLKMTFYTFKENFPISSKNVVA